MITAEEFFRNKIKEQNPNREVVTLSQELITVEQGMRWSHEFKELHLHNVVGRSEQLKAFLDYCDEAGWIKNIDKNKIIKDYNKKPLIAYNGYAMKRRA